MQNQKGKLFLIPAPLNEKDECLSEMQKKSICLLQNFIVEHKLLNGSVGIVRELWFKRENRARSSKKFMSPE